MTWVELVPQHPVQLEYANDGSIISIAGIPITPPNYCCHSFRHSFIPRFYFLLDDTDLVALRLAGVDLRLAEPGEWRDVDAVGAVL
jgi:hypothetical protein